MFSSRMQIPDTGTEPTEAVRVGGRECVDPVVVVLCVASCSKMKQNNFGTIWEQLQIEKNLKTRSSGGLGACEVLMQFEDSVEDRIIPREPASQRT
jgi:hypothetical protein